MLVYMTSDDGASVKLCECEVLWLLVTKTNVDLNLLCGVRVLL